VYSVFIVNFCGLVRSVDQDLSSKHISVSMLDAGTLMRKPQK